MASKPTPAEGPHNDDASQGSDVEFLFEVQWEQQQQDMRRSTAPSVGAGTQPAGEAANAARPGLKRKSADLFEDVNDDHPKKRSSAPPTSQPRPEDDASVFRWKLQMLQADNERLRAQLSHMQAFMDLRNNTERALRNLSQALQHQVASLHNQVSELGSKLRESKQDNRDLRDKLRAQERQQQQQWQEQRQQQWQQWQEQAQRPYTRANPANDGRATDEDMPDAQTDAHPDPPPRRQRGQQHAPRPKRPPPSAKASRPGAKAPGSAPPPRPATPPPPPRSDTHDKPNKPQRAAPPSVAGYPCCAPPSLDSSCRVATLKRFLAEAGAGSEANACSEKPELLALARERVNAWEVRRVLACAQLACAAGEAAADAAAFRRPATRDALRQVQRELMLRVHPDKCPGDQLATAAFQFMQAAFPRVMERMRA